MTRVLLVCGSLQRASANRAALDVARASTLTSSVEVSEFDCVGSIPPLNPDRGDDPGEAVRTFRAQVGAADAVLIGAPEYAGAIAGVLKNALDWIVGSGDLYYKPVALLSAGTSGGVFARWFPGPYYGLGGIGEGRTEHRDDVLPKRPQGERLALRLLLRGSLCTGRRDHPSAGPEAVQPGVSDLERVGLHLPLRAKIAAP